MPTTPPPTSRHKSPLNHKPLVRFLFARVSSSVAFQMLGVAVGWQMYAITGSVWYLGLVGLAQFLPMFLLTLAVGHVADRYDRRIVARTCQTIEGVAAALLALGSYSGWLNRESILAIMCVVGAARAFEYPLNLTISGDGSVNGDFACTSASCNPWYFGATQLILNASTTSYTVFGGWTGDCTTIDGKRCDVTMNGIRNITATFTTAANARTGKLPFTLTTPHSTLALAFGAVKVDEIVQARAIEFTGPLTVTRQVTFKGGYDAEYLTNSGSFTIFKGKLTVGTGGRLNVEGLKIR